ncbi:MAG: DUF3800 domain-containing protein [Deltaproteobacteria bacterium]|nr:DUF3800 domain-containing protein [Deltaproteobacteria bacterium]
MYLLYLDESGDENNANDRNFVLGGIAVFERTTYFLASAVDALQEKHFPNSPPIFFHATDIRTGSDFWRRVPEAKRVEVMNDLVSTVVSTSRTGVVLFSAVIEKSASVYGEKAVELAIEQVCRRFDIFLMRRYQEENDPQRGLLIFSEGRFDKRAKLAVRAFRELGTQWGNLRNLADIPYFAGAKETRLLQLADLVAYSTYQLYEKNRPTLLQSMVDRFDQKDRTLHGLVHCRASSRGPACTCPACASRLRPGDFGDWLPAASPAASTGSPPGSGGPSGTGTP